MPKTLKTVTKELASRHRRKKQEEEKLAKSRKEFFAFATEAAKEGQLAHKTVAYDTATLNEAHTLAIQEYPEWTVIASRPYPDGAEQLGWEIIIEENPEFKPWEYVNESLGLVFQREIRAGTTQLDDDRLKEEDPELWKKVMQKVVSYEPRDFDELDPDTVAAVQPYVFRGKPTVALPAPKRVKEEK